MRNIVAMTTNVDAYLTIDSIDYVTLRSLYYPSIALIKERPGALSYS